MSGIFGIFNRNGKTVEEKTVNTILDAMSYWEPDDTGKWIDGPVALGHSMLWNTPESKYESFPVQNDAYVLTMDARIDNRDELAKEIELPNRPLLEIGDSEFILGAYKKWGNDCPKYLLGDFAFVIWDEKRQQLFCARDHVGIKPFYYHLDDEKFFFSNDIGGLTIHSDISKTIDSRAVGIFLTIGELWDPKITFFESIKKLPPATTMIITTSEMTQNIYWKAEDSPKIKLNSMDEYAAKLRDLLQQSVHARTRSMYQVTSHLSGGLDSSTISVIAARHLQKEGKNLLTFNWVHSPKQYDNPEHFEWSYSKEIASRENIAHHYIEINEKSIFDIWKNLDLASGDTVDLWYEFIVRKNVKDFNSRVILSGWGGDELITASGRTLIVDEISRGNLLKAIKKMIEETLLAKNPIKRFFGLLYRDVYVYLYDAISNKVNREKIDQKNLKYCSYGFKNYILKNNIGIGSKLPNFRHRDRQLHAYSQGHIQNRLESWSVAGAAVGIEYRYPLLDKRIVEFALGIPAEVYRKNGYLRYLIRHTTSDILTEEIRWGNTKFEIERVKKLYFLELKAVTLLMSELEDNVLFLRKNKYIDTDKLFQDKKVLKKISQEKYSYENYDIITRKLQSLQILNLLYKKDFFEKNMENTKIGYFKGQQNSKSKIT